MTKKHTLSYKTTLLLLIISAICLCSCGKRSNNKAKTSADKIYWKKIESIANEAEKFAIKKKLSPNYCVLVDYGKPSGKPRVYVWDFKNKKVLFKTYTMHGCGGGSTAAKPVFSNTLGSNCSTLGHFSITRQHGTINPNGYRLKGLDKANANAWDRALMIHDSQWVDNLKHLKYIPLNEYVCQGCVTIETSALKKLKTLVDNEKKLILLESFVIE